MFSLVLLAGLSFSEVSAPVEVCFTGCEAKILEEISHAKSEIKLESYIFTSKPIIEALQAAAHKGLHVELFLDSANRERDYGLSTTFAVGPGLAHEKAIIIDREVVIGGSYNYTWSAEHKNAEDVLIVRSKEVAKEFLNDWTRRGGPK